MKIMEWTEHEKKNLDKFRKDIERMENVEELADADWAIKFAAWIEKNNTYNEE